MLKFLRQKKQASYPILLALILQVAITGLLCAAAPYQASAKSFMICSSFGIKTITLDENGNPVENADHSKFAKSCFHCASGGCGVATLSNQDLPAIPPTLLVREMLPSKLLPLSYAALKRPATRAPPIRL